MPNQKLSKQQQGQHTRAAILAAAEKLFAAHGYEGARVDAIAAAAGHNKTLIFRYFKNKLGLYAAVLQRADQELGQVLKQLILPLLEDPAIASDPARFYAFLETTIGGLFDYLVAHPRLTRIVNWEQAAAWQTLVPIAAQFAPDEFEQLAGLFAAARAAGLLRADLDVPLALLLIQQLCWSAPNSIPLYQLFLGERASSKAKALVHLRAQVMAVCLYGLRPAR
jgi:TetR/AcrR family transcriptional regulator